MLSKTTNATFAGIANLVAVGRKYYSGLEAQVDLISQLRCHDQWLLIILDACRYDAFREIVPEFINCTHRPVWSSGRNTFEYIRRSWPDNYPEVTYLSAAPVVNANQRDEESGDAIKMFRGYVASEHISDIVELFRHDTADKIGTCPPEVVTNAALDIQSDKMVAHYFQPHAPYIGEERIVMRDDRERSDTKLIWDAVRTGDLSLSRVRKAYKANLRRVVNSVGRLIAQTEHDTIVITSDHGEALGEYNVLSHPNEIPYHPKTRIVPWAKVESTEKYDEWSIDSDKSEKTNRQVRDHLSQLGYI